MIKPAIPADEIERQEELNSYSILDTLPEQEYDEITFLASELCNTPISLISLIDDSRQWFKSHHGLGTTETPREQAFCAHVINDKHNPMIVEDSREDVRFVDNPLVTDNPNIIFYAGIPLVTSNGFPLGSLCVIDNKPNVLKESQIKALQALSNQLMKLLELRKNKFEIEAQKLIVDLKNREITDSIAYAKRLQTAILPSNLSINNAFKNNFVLHLPKDIVAGDFYWLEQKGDKILFAVADCTGHGVPGAFVSVVCHSALNRAVREFQLEKPSDILAKVTDLVIETFEKSEEDVKDGMDIALCALDLKNNTLEYAGANNSLYYIRENELMEIKATKQPVGNYYARSAFKNHTLQIKPSDVFYLFTDGYPDQFGGERGKKFKYKNFKNLLFKIHQNKLSDQRNSLLSEFDNWKGDNEQVDDVCILGIKI
ncbi:MAG: SpoIIE family protein phosphatase [Crocinitomix sp.]|nr:SpoIIE family protein phosphatase [Crocinitomix sp.]